MNRLWYFARVLAVFGVILASSSRRGCSGDAPGPPSEDAQWH